MLSKVRSRLTFAHVLALIALFFALGGPSFAAATVSHAARLLTGKQIKNNSLTTKDVKNGSLLAADFKAGQLPAGAPGPAGDTGAPGAKGDPGHDGQDGQDGTSVTSAVEPTGRNCPSGGSKFTSVTGDSYACNGSDGADGSDASSVVFARINNVPATSGLTSQYGSAAGTSVAAAGNPAVEMVAPAAPMTLRDLQVSLTSAPGAGASRRVTVQWTNGPGHIGSIACVVSDTATTCTNTSTTTTVEPGARIWITTDANGGSAVAATNLYVSYRATG